MSLKKKLWLGFREGGGGGLQKIICEGKNCYMHTKTKLRAQKNLMRICRKYLTDSVNSNSFKRIIERPISKLRRVHYCEDARATQTDMEGNRNKL